ERGREVEKSRDRLVEHSSRDDRHRDAPEPLSNGSNNSHNRRYRDHDDPRPPRSRSPSPRRSRQSKEPSTSIMVRGLASTTTETDLEAAVKLYSPISVRIIR